MIEIQYTLIASRVSHQPPLEQQHRVSIDANLWYRRCPVRLLHRRGTSMQGRALDGPRLIAAPGRERENGRGGNG